MGKLQTMNTQLKDKCNPQNERIKHKYRMYLMGPKRLDKKTWTKIMEHIRHYEELNDFEPLLPLTVDEIHNYVGKICAQDLSLSYIDQNLKVLRDFFEWITHQKRYATCVDYNILPYFSLTNNQRKMARAPTYQESYEIDDILPVIQQMPSRTDIQQRNRALVALQTLCGMRIEELATVLLGNLKFDKLANNWFIYITPRNMKVKFAKTRHAYFMPWGDDIKNIVVDWATKLRALGFDDKSPLFPVTSTSFGKQAKLDPTNSQNCIKSQTIRDIFKTAFLSAGLPVYRVHSFRHTIARWAETHGSPEFFNSVSQSLGHSSVQTTFYNYGTLPPSKIGKVLSVSPV